MDRFRVIFNNLECTAEESGAEPALNRQEKIVQFRLLANECSKTKQPKIVKVKKASKEAASSNRVLFRYEVNRVGVNGVVAEVFGLRCRGSKGDDVEQKKNITLSDDEFWPFVFSDQWTNYTGLRVHHGNVLNRLLVTLDRLAGSDGRLLGVSVAHYDLDVDAAAANLGSIPNQSPEIPVRMEFTFYGRKVASHDEQPSEKIERPGNELPSAGLELQGPSDVPKTVTRGRDFHLITDEAAKRRGASDVSKPVTNDHVEIQDVTESPISMESVSDIQDVVDEAHGEQTAIVPIIAFNDYGPTENVSLSAKDHEESGMVAQFATNALQETLGTTESKASQVADETSSLASTTEGDPGAQSPANMATTGTTIASKESIKVGKGKKNVRRSKKRKEKKEKKKKKKKEDGASEPVNEEEAVETVFDSVVFYFNNDGGAKREKTTADKGREQKPTGTRRSQVAQQTVTSAVEEESMISPHGMFERRSKHARANFPNVEQYLSDRQKERKREMCRMKVDLRGAVLITDTCVSAFNSKATAETEEVDEVETTQPEQRLSADDSSQFKNVDQKISLTKKEHHETEKRSSQTEQNENPKTTKKYSIASEVQQHDIDKENTMNEINPKITIEDERTRHSDKDIDKQTENAIVHAGSESKKTTRHINAVSASDRNRLRGNERRKGRSVPTRVAIGQLGRSLTTWIINDPTKWRTKPKETEAETKEKSRCDVEMTTSDFTLVTEFPTENDGDSSNEDLTADTSKLDAPTSAQLADQKRKESAKKQLQHSAKRSRTSSDYARRSKAALEEVQRRSTVKVRSEKLDEVKQTEAKHQPQRKKKVVVKEQPPPTIKVEILRRSRINEWDVDEDFLRHLLLATDRFEVRKECITFMTDRTQTLQFVTFTRPFRNTYC